MGDALKHYIVRVEYETSYSRDVHVYAQGQGEAKESALEIAEEDVNRGSFLAWDESVNGDLTVWRVTEVQG